MKHPISSFSELTTHLQEKNHLYQLSVVCGSDESTISAVMKLVANGYAKAYFVGQCEQIKKHPKVANYSKDRVTFIEAATAEEAAQKAVTMVRCGEADVLVKGLIHTDTLLRAVLNKECGILPKGNILTHIAMCEIPTYHKLLFFSDAAVIPYPTHEQRIQQVGYMADMLHAFGIECPKIALIHCAETASPKFPHTMGYAEICHMANNGRWGRLLVDGPLDLRTACDAIALKVKGIHSPLQGEADALIMPDIESANTLYKALPLFAKARVAGTLQGTSAPVVLPSRGDDAEAKYHSIALAMMGCKSVSQQN